MVTPYREQRYNTPTPPAPPLPPGFQPQLQPQPPAKRHTGWTVLAIVGAVAFGAIMAGGSSSSDDTPSSSSVDIDADTLAQAAWNQIDSSGQANVCAMYAVNPSTTLDSAVSQVDYAHRSDARDAMEQILDRDC